jgi:radical SAM protein with 4Fe4S-binding SPASM domain
MCYIRTPSKDNRAARNTELSSEGWVRIAGDAANNGMVFLLLTGGEVFLRPDFFSIYKPISEMGLVVTIYTNATLLTQSIVDKLAISPPSSMGVTIYGASSSSYEELTGLPDGFDRCCAGIELLLDMKIPLSLRTTITKHNLHEIDAMTRLANGWGLPLSYNWLLTNRRIGSHSSEIEQSRLSALEGVIVEEKYISSGKNESDDAKKTTIDNINDNFFCLAGQSAFSITPEGYMNACISMEAPSARPVDVGFLGAWEKVKNYVDSSSELAPSCRECDSLEYCPRCPAWSLIETNTTSEPVAYLCEVARCRKAIFDAKTEK